MAKTYPTKTITTTGTTISSTDDGRLNGDLPTNVSDESELANLPPECLASYTTGISLVDGGSNYGSSGSNTTDDGGDDDSDEMTNIERPLRHVDDMGNEYFYSLKPMQYSVIFILLVELFERFAFYGIYYTQTLFLTGAYNEDWNAGFTSVKASSFVSISTMVAYTTPFIGAFVSDSLFGDYKSLMIGLLVFYIPGVSLIVLTTIPNLLGDEFNETLLTFGFLFLWPLGTGIVKSIVNGEFVLLFFHLSNALSICLCASCASYVCLCVICIIFFLLIPFLNILVVYLQFFSSYFSIWCETISSIVAKFVDRVLLRLILHSNQRRSSCWNLYHPNSRTKKHICCISYTVVFVNYRWDMFSIRNSTLHLHSSPSTS
jgi:hypothetical protein